MCPSCGERLNKAVYRGGFELKSCPNCSQRAGRHVYYAQELFGQRRMADGSVIVQSWCGPCRGNKPPVAYVTTC